MKILSINSFYNPYKINNKPADNSVLASINRRSIQYSSGDIISFSAKKYEAEQIQNPTNHCAYCGCKVYDKQQIEAKAKSILAAKYSRAEGEIKSILEKLTSAKNSDELATDKREANKEQIDFFENLLTWCENNAYLKGSDVLKKVKGLSQDDALKLITENLHPLLATIDHVSPQRLNQENNNSDINLVEACYCCNHDLKDGLSFSEFYGYYPGIKDNMPKDKFLYAKNQILDVDQENVAKRVSAESLLRRLKGLHGQEKEIQSKATSIYLSIKSFLEKILSAIQGCEDSIAEKQAEIDKKQAILDSYDNDEEFKALLLREEYQAQLNELNRKLEQVTQKKARLSNAINEINNPKKKRDKTKDKEQLTDEQKRQKIAEYKGVIEELKPQIANLCEEKEHIIAKMAELDEKYPPYETVHRIKTGADQIVTAHKTTNQNCKTIEKNKDQIGHCQQRETELQAQIALLPAKMPEAKDNTEEVVRGYERYKEVIAALSHIEQHPNTGATNLTIFEFAKPSLEKEKEALSKNPMVVQEQQYKRRQELTAELKRIEKRRTDLEEETQEKELENKRLKFLCEKMTEEEAYALSEKSAEKLRQLQNKLNDLNLPKQIEVLKSEINLLRDTIQRLEAEKQKIEADYQ
ncbi:hypothetical protein II906_13505 [bacterium]|nr:hypothetical protein [bacterium]